MSRQGRDTRGAILIAVATEFARPWMLVSVTLDQITVALERAATRR